MVSPDFQLPEQDNDVRRLGDMLPLTAEDIERIENWFLGKPDAPDPNWQKEGF